MNVAGLRNRHFFVADLIFLPVALYLSYVLRLESFILGQHWPGFLLLVALSWVVVPLVFWRTGIYARYWRYASVEEMLLLIGAVTLGVLSAGGLGLAAVQFMPQRWPLPRSIPLIFLSLALAVTAGPRFLFRLSARPLFIGRFRKLADGRAIQPVLIMGAGDAGAMIVRELQQNPHLGLEPVGFLDDDPTKHGAVIHGVSVLGDRHQIVERAAQYHVKQVIIAMPTAPGKTIREIIALCEQAGVQARIVPGLYELLGGTVSVSQLRPVQIEDLLRRDPVQTDTAAVGELLRGKRVLVTGGGGSIGSELCRQILRYDPAQLIILGHGENSVFEIVEELRVLEAKSWKREAGSRKRETGGQPSVSSFQFPASRITPVIAGTRFPQRIRRIFEEYRPQIVFHAAAHKHVPLMESNPCEAITNNVMGTRTVLDAALATGVEHFVMISTDKAVNPTNIMGASKRIAELLVYQAAQISGKPYVAVRFGNVLGSRGSVIHTFRRQIAAGGPVTVTHPEMRRYFMTIPEAVQLVLQAAVLGKGGEIFVLDMGEPVKIVDLARDLIEFSGLKVGRDIDIVFTGLRPGEKLFEELFVPGEEYVRTAHHKIFVATNGAANAACCIGLDAAVERLIEVAWHGDRQAIVRAVKELVPEYRPDDLMAGSENHRWHAAQAETLHG